MLILTENIYSILLHKDIDHLKSELGKRELKITKEEIRIIQNLKEKIALIYPDMILILYGSRARGDFREGSDYDLCILLKVINESTKSQISDLIWETGFENDMLFQTVYFSYDDFFSDRIYKTRHVQTMLNDGILINGSI